MTKPLGANLDVAAVVLAAAVGVMIGYVDSRPGWDDAGITAAALVIASGLLAFLRPRLWWLVALAVGLPVVAFNYLLHANLGSAMSLIFTFVAGGVGAAVGRAVGPAESPSRR